MTVLQNSNRNSALSWSVTVAAFRIDQTCNTVFRTPADSCTPNSGVRKCQLDTEKQRKFRAAYREESVHRLCLRRLGTRGPLRLQRFWARLLGLLQRSGLLPLDLGSLMRLRTTDRQSACCHVMSKHVMLSIKAFKAFKAFKACQSMSKQTESERWILPPSSRAAARWVVSAEP